MDLMVYLNLKLLKNGATHLRDTCNGEVRFYLSARAHCHEDVSFNIICLNE